MSSVEYTTKELFEKIDQKLDRLDTKLDTKADHQHVIDLVERGTVLEQERAERRGASRTNWVIIGLLGTIAALLIPIAVAVLQ